MVMAIKRKREAVEMTQQLLAERMGVAQTTISQWETEVALPRARQLPQLAEVLGCSISELFEDPGETGPVSA